MTTAVYIGIDPGLNGGIAVLSDMCEVVFLQKMPPTPADLHEFLQEVVTLCKRDNVTLTAFLEDVGHGLPGQSSSATAKFARHCGHLEMALLALGIKTVTVTPAKWQKEFQLGKSSGKKTEWKNKLKAKAQQLYPVMSKWITLATADALLIAEYGRRQK